MREVPDELLSVAAALGAVRLFPSRFPLQIGSVRGVRTGAQGAYADKNAGWFRARAVKTSVENASCVACPQDTDTFGRMGSSRPDQCVCQVRSPPGRRAAGPSAAHSGRSAAAQQTLGWLPTDPQLPLS